MPRISRFGLIRAVKAYIDCPSGLSGDMFLAALLDAGTPLKEVERAIGALKLRGLKIVVRTESRGPIRARRVIVKTPSESQERNFKTIRGMLKKATGLSPQIRDRAILVFELLAEAESRIHGEPKDHIHFHEVGALDSIADIVGVCAALEYLAIDEMICSSVPLGSGKTDSRHGVIPLPAPATVELLKGFIVHGTGVQSELTTPTGAAILRAFASESGPMPAMKIKKVGYGAGSRILPDRPNVLRIIIGEKAADIGRDRSVIMEASVDDMLPQDFDPMMEALFEAGAHDVLLIPVHMKKNRPGVLVQALAPEGAAGTVTEALFRHSSTLGIRSHVVDRRILKRAEREQATAYGNIRYKMVGLPGGTPRITPEFEDLKAAAKKAGVSMEKVRRAFWDRVDS